MRKVVLDFKEILLRKNSRVDRLFDVLQAAAVYDCIMADLPSRSAMIFVQCIITSAEVESPAETDEAVLF